MILRVFTNQPNTENNNSLYEFTFTKTVGGVVKERKYQIPATNEVQAALELGQIHPHQQEYPYNETIITLISVKKVG